MSFKSIQILRKGVVSGGDPATRWQGHHHSTNYVGLGLKTQFLPVLFVWRLDLNIQCCLILLFFLSFSTGSKCGLQAGQWTHTHTHTPCQWTTVYCLYSLILVAFWNSDINHCISSSNLFGSWTPNLHNTIYFVVFMLCLCFHVPNVEVVFPTVALWPTVCPPFKLNMLT